jgi:hypothetical protein
MRAVASPDDVHAGAHEVQVLDLAYPEGVLGSEVLQAPCDRRVDAVHDRSGGTQAVLDRVIV